MTGNCTVVRLDLALSPASPPKLTSSTVIGTDFPWRANKAALILAPTGLALGGNGTLYVDDTLTNSVSAIPQALTRTSVITAAAGNLSAGGALDAPLGMTLAPNGDLVVVNGNNGNAIEITPAGKQLATRTLIKNGAATCSASSRQATASSSPTTGPTHWTRPACEYGSARPELAQAAAILAHASERQQGAQERGDDSRAGLTQAAAW